MFTWSLFWLFRTEPYSDPNAVELHSPRFSPAYSLYPRQNTLTRWKQSSFPKTFTTTPPMPKKLPEKPWVRKLFLLVLTLLLAQGSMYIGIHMLSWTEMVSLNQISHPASSFSSASGFCLSLVLTNRSPKQAAFPHWRKTGSPITGLQPHCKKRHTTEMTEMWSKAILEMTLLNKRFSSPPPDIETDDLSNQIMSHWYPCCTSV